MLSLMLPESVVGCEIRGDVAEPLFPQERSYLERAVEGRRAEFATVRFCARRALGGLGLDRPVMVPGPHREPSWPDGVVGAMTHCEGYRAAAVAWARDADAIGIDAELVLPYLPIVSTHCSSLNSSLALTASIMRKFA